MYALGDFATVGNLRCAKLEVDELVEGAHLGSHLRIGNTTTKNTASINQTDSLLHVNYAFYLNVVGGAATSGSSVITLTTTSPHNLIQGDTVEVEHASTILADFDFDEIDGEHIVATGSTGTTLKLLLGRIAAIDDTNNSFTCGVHGTHYKYIDLASDDGAWNRATKLPAIAGHVNINPPATWAPY